jgi:hypothetical protein
MKPADRDRATASFSQSYHLAADRRSHLETRPVQVWPIVVYSMPQFAWLWEIDMPKKRRERRRHSPETVPDGCKWVSSSHLVLCRVVGGGLACLEW